MREVSSLLISAAGAAVAIVTADDKKEKSGRGRTGGATQDKILPRKVHIKVLNRAR